MADNNATILIPDISGFTEFMTTTELTHASHAINYLIDAMLNAVGEEYHVAEIEGDAVLLIKKGPPPSKKEIHDTCLKIFNAFHYQRKWMQQHTVCPCGACQAIINLTLKFIAHHGPVAEIKVGRFVKPSGTEMIVAHRLLKNSINNNEYLLLTEKLFQGVTDTGEEIEIEWTSSSEEYPSLGKVDYRYTLLNEAKKNVPDPPAVHDQYRTDNTSFLELPIDSNYFDVYMRVTNIPGREEWMPGLKKVEQDGRDVYIGSVHHCTFEDYQAVISPLRMTVSQEGIIYAERWSITDRDLSLVYEFVFKKIDEQNCSFAARFMNEVESAIPKDINIFLFEGLQQMAQSLKAMSEKKRDAALQH